MPRLGRLIKLAVSVFYGLTYVMPRFVWNRILGQAPWPRPVILCYHAVYDSQADGFRRQAHHLAKHTDVWPLCRLGCDARAPRWPVVITFDDAFAVLLDEALPVLRALRLPSTIFVPAGCLGENAPWIRDPEHDNYGSQVIDMESLCALASDMVTIGSHSLTHAYLPSLDRSQLQRELLLSREFLSRLPQSQLRALALPYGDCSESILSVSQQCGYDSVFTGLPHTPVVWNGVHIYGRVPVSPEDWPIEFWLKIRQGYNWLPRAVAWKRRLLALLNVRRSGHPSALPMTTGIRSLEG